MPTREQIQKEVDSLRRSGQDAVRHKYLKRLHAATGRDLLIYFSSAGIARPYPTPQAAVSVSPDDIQGFMAGLHGLKGEQLDLVLHSPGGSLDAADQIVQYLRAKYKHIRAIVPQSAMSAATMIACACDEIVMGKHSAIGPIDPQFNINGAAIPAHAILQEFDKAKSDISSNPVLGNLWLPRLQQLPPGFLNLCEQTIELAKVKVAQWLGTYMFAGAPGAQAQDIAAWLGDFNEHKTHGRPIGIALAQAKGLKVTALEDDQRLQEAVLSVFHATMVTFQGTHCLKLIENQNGKGHYLVAAQVIQGIPPGQPVAGEASLQASE
jgi:hypothetical protein